MELNFRYSLTVPDGISGVGIQLINQLLSAQQGHTWLNTFQALPQLPFDYDFAWKNSEGKLTTRLSHHYYRHYRLKLPTELVSEVGNIASLHMQAGETYHFEFTNRIDWEAGDFDDAGSCLWEDRRAGRQAIQDNGAWAILFFNPITNYGEGRAFLYNAETFYIVWNGYGHSTLKIASVLAQFLNQSYQKIRLENNGSPSGQVWINSASGYVVGPRSIIRNVDDFDFHWEVGCECYNCGRLVHEDWQYTGADDETYCERCYYEIFDSCEECGSTYYRDDLDYVDEQVICEYCRDRIYTCCDKCHEYHRGERCPNCRK